MNKETRITSLLIKRSWKNRFSWWLYERWCNEPFIPEGKVSVLVEKKGDTPASIQDIVKISFTPKKFTKGIHEWYIFGQFSEITFWKDLFKDK